MPRSCEPPQLLLHPTATRVRWYAEPHREYTCRELLADRFINFAMAALAWVGAVTLSYTSWLAGDPWLLQLAFALHGFGMVAMSHSSAVFHYYSFDHGAAARLYCYDQMGINMMLIGCTTPVLLQSALYARLAFVLALGAFGIVGEVRLLLGDGGTTERAGKGINNLRFLAMGWVCHPCVHILDQSFSPVAGQGLLAGGGLFTVGICFLTFKPLEFHQAIWHGFVLVASGILWSVNALFLSGGAPLLAVH